jgi:hypothetical protein
LTNKQSYVIIKIQRTKEITTMKTINDYLAMVKELRELGQQLVAQQYNECDEVAEWVEEVECMDIHLECCANELRDAGVEG